MHVSRHHHWPRPNLSLVLGVALVMCGLALLMVR